MTEPTPISNIQGPLVKTCAALMAGLRQVFGVAVCPGNQHTAKHAQPGLLKTLDVLPPEKIPRLAAVKGQP